MMFFLIPRIPEWIMSRFQYQAIAKAFRSRTGGCVRHDAVTRADAALFQYTMSTSLTTALNYYRANVTRHPSPRMPPITAPTLLVWGEQDMALEGACIPLHFHPRVVAPDHLRVAQNPLASHWVNQDDPATTNAAIRDFLSSTH